MNIKDKDKKTKHAAEIGVIKTCLKKCWGLEKTFDYKTKFKRHIASGDYQQTKADPRFWS